MDRLSPLPDEVLLHIWMRTRNPVPLSLTSKRFQALSQETLWRAKWLVQQYESYLVIFEAIARPKLFTPALFQQLTRLGAPLSRELVQLLHFLRDPIHRVEFLREDSSLMETGPVLWGKNVSFPAYGAVVSHAAELVSHHRASVGPSVRHSH